VWKKQNCSGKECLALVALLAIPRINVHKDGSAEERTPAIIFHRYFRHRSPGSGSFSFAGVDHWSSAVCASFSADLILVDMSFVFCSVDSICAWNFRHRLFWFRESNSSKKSLKDCIFKLHLIPSNMLCRNAPHLLRSHLALWWLLGGLVQ
jgi:hypothetical protein